MRPVSAAGPCAVDGFDVNITVDMASDQARAFLRPNRAGRGESQSCVQQAAVASEHLLALLWVERTIAFCSL